MGAEDEGVKIVCRGNLMWIRHAMQMVSPLVHLIDDPRLGMLDVSRLLLLARGH